MKQTNIVSDNSKSNYDTTNAVTYNTEVLKSNFVITMMVTF